MPKWRVIIREEHVFQCEVEADDMSDATVKGYEWFRQNWATEPQSKYADISYDDITRIEKATDNV